MADVLFVSKPVAPPWNDSSKNLVRDLSCAMERHTPVVLGRKGGGFSLPRGHVAAIYPAASGGGFAPALLDQLRVLGRVLTDRRAAIVHYFFAPNPRTSRVARGLSRLRRTRTVQTVCSAPRDQPALADLFFADRTVVLSRRTEELIAEAGVPREKITRIAPAIAALSMRSEEERAAIRRELGLPSSAPLVVYPGDLEFGTGADLTLAAALASAHAPHLVMACRLKTSAAREAERNLRSEASRLGLASRVTWIGETTRIHDLLACADVVALPATTLYAKMDYPLVVLEAMSLERACIVARGTPAEELAEGEGVLAVEPSMEAITGAIDALLADDAARRALGARGRESVARDFSPRAMARAYETLYDTLVP